MSRQIGPIALALVLLIVVLAPAGSGGPATAARAPDSGVRALGPSAVRESASETGLIAVTVTNPTVNSTGTFDQRIVVNSYAYSNLINSNFTNVLAYYAANQTPIYGWIESGASNSSSATTLWLRLYSIPAESSVSVLLACGPKDSFDLSESGFMGESPVLSSTYAEFDNGWRVFNLYDNFSGRSLSSLWNLNGGWRVDVHQGAHYDYTPGDGGNVTSRATFSYPMAVDFYGDLYQTTSLSAYVNEGIGYNGCTGCGDAMGVAWISGSGTDPGPATWTGNLSAANWGNSVGDSQEYGVFSSIILANDMPEYAVNYQPVAPPDPITMPYPGQEPVALATTGFPSGGLTNNETTYWIREYSYQPDVVVSLLGAVGPLTVGLAAYPATLLVNQSLTLATESSGGIAPVSFAYSGLPPGCVSANRPTLSCEVTQAGNFDVTVQVTDSLGATNVSSVNVTVYTSQSSTPPPVEPLSATLVALPAEVVAGNVVQLITFASGGTAPYSYTYSGLPAGCSSADAPMLSCVADATGTLTPSVSVTDSGDTTANSTTSVEVSSPTPAPLVATLVAYPPSALANETVTLVTTVTGGTAPYTYSYANEPYNCPAGSAAILTCAGVAAGTYSVTVTVRDAAGLYARAETNFTLTSGPTSTPIATTSGASSVPAWELYALAGLGVAALAVAAVAVVAANRRRNEGGGPPSG